MAAPLLASLVGQDTARATLERALAAGRVHHAYLFDGQDGVGKELAALGLAQALVCEKRPPAGATACGACSACERVPIRKGEEHPRHPDVILLERGLYTPDQIGRRTPETQDLSIDQVRTLILARAAYPPHEGRARVYIVRRAEELSTAAANALLKTLEEPGDKTHFVLLSSRAGSLLPTILSRTLRVRFGPLPDAVVTDLLVREGLAASDARAVATLARGSMTVAAALGDPESTAARQAFVDKALLALRSKGIGPALEVAEEAKKQKGDLDVHLAALLRRLAEDSLARASEPGGGARRARQCSVALEAMEELDGNANAQLVVESMLLRMRSV